jgi:hypothetical protein
MLLATSTFLRSGKLKCHLRGLNISNNAPDFQQTNSYPTSRLETGWGVPVEVSLIAQLSHGEGTSLFADATNRQKAHERFKDELDEPSCKIGATRLDLLDKTALYTFAVGSGGHPFHRHQGHRVVVGVSGSGGTDLRFSYATPHEVVARKAAFVEKMHVIRVPADCIFTMRFDGRVWHQFSPTPCPLGFDITPINPAFFAISVHTDETNGDFDAQTQDLISKDEACIASLTELLPTDCDAALDIDNAIYSGAVPITKLSLERSAGQEEVCRFARGTVGGIRTALASAMQPKLTGAGFTLTAKTADERSGAHFVVKEFPALFDVPDWFAHAISQTLPSASHTDVFEIKVPALNVSLADFSSPLFPGAKHSTVVGSGEIALAKLLEGFIENAPRAVGRVQALRNAIVRPMGLRTSPLGCPVSSLLGESETLFAGRFPVHTVLREESSSTDTTCVAVVLGADDVHLRFRTIVGVDTKAQTAYMCTRVETLNLFGSIYYSLIDWTHRRFITPQLMRHAAAFATASVEAEPKLANR